MKHPIHLNKTMYDVREETRDKIEQLTTLGYHVREMWECEWNLMINTNLQVKEFVDKLDIVPPLNLHEAFFAVEPMPSNCSTRLKMKNRSITVT